MLLDLSNPFTMEVKYPDGKTETIKSTFRDLTKQENKKYKQQQEEVDKITKQASKIIKSLERLSIQGNIKRELKEFRELEKINEDMFKKEDELKELEEKLSNMTDKETILKDKFNLCLGENKDKIIELAESQGYEKVYKVIVKSIAEEQEGKSKE